MLIVLAMGEAGTTWSPTDNVTSDAKDSGMMLADEELLSTAVTSNLAIVWSPRTTLSVELVTTPALFPEARVTKPQFG